MSNYRWKDIAWRDLSLIPILLASQFILAMVVLVIQDVYTPQWLAELDLLEATEVLAGVGSYCIVIFSFWLLHTKTMPIRFQLGIKGVRRYWLWIIGTYIVTMGLMQIYGEFMTFLPEQYQYDTTQNEAYIEQSLGWNALLPFNFLWIVILAPVVEEIVFRHFLIGELGKKFNFRIMAIVSAILFAGIHVTDAASPFEFVDYFILAVPMVWLYLKSGRNLGVTIGLHILNNFISFMLDII
ncbi:CPBP family intramembrane glutamic endopeptidase [Staphylococcus sp. 17KM0847]|uniref:CPBP family intramembrane glutamic endopeptidase n=1 Tax=Staphylococcus sp. 17KM0847 TaxID=2583989 RepID=UPI0015DCE353|nr:type II CAAX endopeptidase family protein [Staphylococcus sp. 17KM0847]QLK86673.1 CPBP family intramembrane metalloprotease [Staphylococcus sp. 17KM0847]